MAKNKFSLDFDGFLDFAYKIDELGGSDALKKATENALTESKTQAEIEIGMALKNSKYSFTAGKKYSTGGVRNSFVEVAKMPVEWDGDICKAYVGVDTAKEPEILFTMYGTPHMTGDSKLKQAVKVQGPHRAKIDKIQKAEFEKVLNEVMNHD